jgi:uncharacterized protein (TIGR02996 family)
MAKRAVQPASPSIKGQPLTYWLERLTGHDAETARQARDAFSAIRALSVRQKAAFAPVVPELLRAWTQGNFTERMYLCQCFDHLGPVVVPHLPQFFEQLRSRSGFAEEPATFLLQLAQQGNLQALHALIYYLDSVLAYGVAVQALAVGAGTLGEAAAPLVPYLTQQFAKAYDDAACAIVTALGEIGAGVPCLIQALQHRHAATRQNAVAALPRLKVEDAIDPLVELLRHPDYPTVAAAANALSEFGTPAARAVPQLQAALSSRSKVVREAAQAALQKFPASEAKAAKKPRIPPRMAKPTANSAALLQGILDNPHDDACRLVYADWLEEQGQAERAEFIRVSCDWASLPEDDPRREDLLSREQALLSDYRKDWLQEVPVWAAQHISFERGFVGEVRCTVKAFLKGAAGLFRRVPIVSLGLGSGASQGQALADCPFLARISRLNLAAPEEDVRLLLASPHLANLTSLTLSMCDLGDETLALLASRPILERLTELNVLGNRFGPEGVRALAQSRHLRNLQTLYLGGNENLGDAGVRCLAASPHLRKLTDLGLWVNGITAAGAQVLAQSEVCRTLKRLRIGNNPLGDAGAAALARSPWLANLAELDLLHSEIGDEGAQALANSPTLGNLVHLELPTNAIGPAGAVALANSRHLTRLRRLFLLYNPIGDEGALALARSSLPLVRIEVGVGFGEEATAALRQR